MKELNDLKNVALTLTTKYGTSNNTQKRNLWQAINTLEKKLLSKSCHR